MSRAFIGLGSNVNREANLAGALVALRKRYGALTVSRVYESEPIGFEGANFYNLVIGLETETSPQALSKELRQIESEHGRRRGNDKFIARALDLDLLLFDDLIFRDRDIDVPRSDVTDYAFVLRPLSEIAGEQRHPETGECYRNLWQEFEASHKVRLWPVEEAIDRRSDESYGEVS